MGLEVEIDGDGESGRAGRGDTEEREWRNSGRGSSLAAGMGGRERRSLEGEIQGERMVGVWGNFGRTRGTGKLGREAREQMVARTNFGNLGGSVFVG